jgi:hypothetical protein
MLTFRPRRQTQPYRNPFEREQSPQLAAMLGGRPLNGPNPMDHQRAMQRLAAMLLGRRF